MSVFSKGHLSNNGGHIQVGPAFTPASLFTASEQGAWYDPSDFSTLYQDSAGTTAVTTVEQPVGLMLDKSQGLVLGSELVTNGTFDTDTTGWIAVNSTLSVASGGMKIEDNGVFTAAYQGISTVVGKSYILNFDLVDKTNNIFVELNFGTGTSIPDGSSYYYSGTGTQVSNPATGSYKIIFTATATTTYISFGVNSTNYITVDNISVRELPGNHAKQATSAARPALRNRYNLLTFSEQFDNAYWLKTNATITANATTAPDGLNTADKLVESASTAGHYLEMPTLTVISGTVFVYSIFAKAAERSILQIAAGSGDITGNGRANFDLSSGSLGTVDAGITASIENKQNGWYRCKVEIVIQSTALNFTSGIVSSSSSTRFEGYTGDGTSGIYVWGAQLVTADDNTAIQGQYQRIEAAPTIGSAPTYDDDLTKFPPYLAFDGSDDSMATASIDFSATDEMTVFAGVTKLSDAADGIVAELSANANTSNGAFWLAYKGGQAGDLGGFSSRGTVLRQAVTNSAAYAAPITSVLTGLSDISEDATRFRIDSTQVAQNTGDLGTGNYGNYPLYIGSRGGTIVRFNGRLYGLIVRGKQTVDSDIEATEAYLATKTGIAL